MTRTPAAGAPVKNMQTYNQTAASTNGAMLLLAVRRARPRQAARPLGACRGAWGACHDRPL